METDQLKHQVLEEIRLLSDPDDEAVAEAVVRVLGAEGRQHFLSLKKKQVQARTLFNAIRRLDILQELIDDEGITEIMIIGTAVFVEEAGRIRKWEKEFSSMETVEDIVQRIAGNSNRMLNTRTPMADARLPDGSRVHLVVPPVALDGPVVTIRRFPKDPIRMRDLIAWESISEEAAAFLERLVRAGYNLFISGGTGSGKTTFLNALTEEEFDAFIRYHMSTCERMDLMGASGHTVDILTK